LLKIKLLNSSPHYVQANGQAETTNKSLTRLIKKKIDENPRRWHEVLSEALWAHRTTQHGATKVTPFELVYGQEAMLPAEINAQACRAAKQEMLSAGEYVKQMMDVIDKVPESRLEALQEIESGKLKALRAYNKRAKEKSFQVGDLVWKTILPIGTQSSRIGKWSPSWEGPYIVTKVVPGSAYFMKTLEGQKLEMC
jgi:hypothetical protein